MYLKKVEHLKSLFPIENCISAITTAGTANGASVGTPCIVNIKPFAANRLDTKQRGFNMPNRNEINIIYTNRQSEQPVRGRAEKIEPAPAKEPKKNLTQAKDLYEMGVSKANELIRNHISKTQALFAFSTHNDYTDFYTIKVYGHQIYFDGTKPIILDNNKRLELSRLSDVHSKTELSNFAEMTYNSLQNNRYINYTFTDVMESNKKYMMEDINLVFNSLKKIYPHNISCFGSLPDNLRSLIDVVSVSFYRLSDVVAVFDFNNTVGMGVEVLMTNSLYDSKAVSKGERSVTYRFLFSLSRENLFTIDGESVSRPSDCRTEKALGFVHRVISEEVPYDKALKSKKAKPSK